MDIQATTGRFNPSLGKQDNAQARSGKAIQALKLQGEQTSSNYLENLANIAIAHEGRVLLDMLKYVYDRPGRIVRLLGDDPAAARGSRHLQSLAIASCFSMDGAASRDSGAGGVRERGEHGHGYDPIFVPEGFGVTAAELEPEVKNSMSHRALALEQLASYLNAVAE